MSKVTRNHYPWKRKGVTEFTIYFYDKEIQEEMGLHVLTNWSQQETAGMGRIHLVVAHAGRDDNMKAKYM